MVDVEERALGSLQEDVVAAPEGILDEPRHVGEMRSQPSAPGEALLDERLDLEPLVRQERAEHGVLLGQDPGELRAQRVGVEQVLEAQACPGRAILVRRPDPPSGRPHLRLAEARLAGDVEGAVVRQDHVAGEARPQPPDVDPARG